EGEYRRRGAVEHESFRCEERESKPGMEKAAPAHKSFARVLAVDHAVQSREVIWLVTFAASRRADLPGVCLCVLDPLGRCRVRGEKIRGTRIDTGLAGIRLKSRVPPHGSEKTRPAVRI